MSGGVGGQEPPNVNGGVRGGGAGALAGSIIGANPWPLKNKAPGDYAGS